METQIESTKTLPEKIIKKVPGSSGEPGKCEIHETDKQRRVFTIGGEEHEIYECHDCLRDNELDHRMKMISLSLSQGRQENFNRMLDNAMISARFKNKSLENWKAITLEQQKAFKAIEWFKIAYVTSPGLLLTGKPGTGKNHLACGLAKFFISDLNKTALITTAFKIIRKIKSTWRPESKETEDEIIKGFIDVDLLVIDEIGVQFGSETEMLYLTEIINDRYEAMKPTILISNKCVSDLTAYLGERIIDRFREGGRVVIFDWESYRAKFQGQLS